jgi:hypothetical protein
MEHNINISQMLPDRSPSARGQPMNINGQTAPAGSREAAKLAQKKYPPSPKYIPTSRRMDRPPFPIDIGSKSVGSPSEAEDMLFDLAAPEVYNPGNMPSSPMQRTMTEQQQTAHGKLSPLDQYASNLGPTSRGFMRSG